MVLEAHLADGLLDLTVSDHGAWRSPVDRGGGWGMHLIDGLMDSVDVNRRPGGTVVRMRRQLWVRGTSG
jgi:anti-sigma regulatory factor (Ser/Thr protein kinase)